MCGLARFVMHFMCCMGINFPLCAEGCVVEIWVDFKKTNEVIFFFIYIFCGLRAVWLCNPFFGTFFDVCEIKEKIMRQTLKILFLAITFGLLSSCASVRVSTDYDKMANFSQKKTFAFLKEGIDRVEVSDLDKKRIMRAIEAEMVKKGYAITDTNPDVFVNFFTREEQMESVYNNMGVGFGWGPFYFSRNMISRETQGTLFIDIIDGQGKDLIWQGKGEGSLMGNDKDQMVYKFVSSILNNYPPKQMLQSK